jgi:hypothetical protein
LQNLDNKFTAIFNEILIHKKVKIDSTNANKESSLCILDKNSNKNNYSDYEIFFTNHGEAQ